MLTADQQSVVRRVLSPFLPEYIGVFGSCARGDEKPGSDVDILVRFGKPLTLFDLVGLELDLSEELRLRIDLVTEHALNPMIREFVEKDLKEIGR
jgi:uncharacterized protein